MSGDPRIKKSDFDLDEGILGGQTDPVQILMDWLSTRFQ